LIVVNALWLMICVYAYFVVSPTEFYIAAGLVGMVMGGIQALSRSTTPNLCQKPKTPPLSLVSTT